MVLCGFGEPSGLGKAHTEFPTVLTATVGVSMSRLSRSGLPATTHTRLLTYKVLRMKYNLRSASSSSVSFSDFLPQPSLHISCWLSELFPCDLPCKKAPQGAFSFAAQDKETQMMVLQRYSDCTLHSMLCGWASKGEWKTRAPVPSIASRAALSWGF